MCVGISTVFKEALLDHLIFSEATEITKIRRTRGEKTSQ